MFQRTHIVDERIEPDVGHVALIERNFNAPFQTALRTGNAKVPDGFAQHRYHLIFETRGSDEVWMLFYVSQQPVLVFAHAKEIVLFLDNFRDGLMIRALTVYQFLLCIEALAAEAVEPTVTVEVDVSAFVNPRQELLHVTDMVGIRGTNEVIVSEPAALPCRAKARADLVREYLRLHSRLRGRLRDFVAMFVRTGEIKSLVTIRPVIARQRVGHDHGVGAAQMRLCIDVVEWCCNVDSVHQCSPTIFNRTFSNTMRRFRFLCMLPTAPAV